jgi:hypothetical protein
VFNENIDYFIYYNLVVWGASVLLMLKMNPEYYNRFMQILKSKLRLSPNK